MTAKCELKQYIADEAEKEKKLLETKLEQANREIKELIDANEIHQQLKHEEVKAKHIWATQTRKNFLDPEQAQMFFEAYKLQLAKEQSLREDKNVLQKEIKEYQMKLQMIELENTDLKKKFNKLKKEKLEEAQQRHQQTTQQVAQI